MAWSEDPLREDAEIFSGIINVRKLLQIYIKIMKKNTGVTRISEKQELAVRDHCAKHGVSRSALFRRIILWAISCNLPIPKQRGTFRFETANANGGAQQRSYLFGSKLSSDIILKINSLCKFHGVEESHLYRCFLEGYIMAQTGRVRQRPLVTDRPISKPKVRQSHNFPYAIFRNANFNYKFEKPDTDTLIGRIQASSIEGIEMRHNLSSVVGLAVVLLSTFSRK